MGVVSSAALSACKVDDADKKLLPYLVPPDEGVVPGVPRFVRSTCMECPANCGIEVKVLDDMPVKLEGNPGHPVNKGRLCLRGQAALARLYHPRRFKQPLMKDENDGFKPVSWQEARNALNAALEKSEKDGLRKVFLSSHTTGSLDLFIDEFCEAKHIERLKEVEIYCHDAIKQANNALFGRAVVPGYRIDRCDALLTVGADIFETFLSPVQWARQYAEARKNSSFQWFHVEPYLTLTGASANERRDIYPGSEAYLLEFLLHHVSHRQAVPKELMAQAPGYPLDELVNITGLAKNIVLALVKTLETAKQPLIICGGPSIAHRNGTAAAFYTALLQWALGMTGNTVDFDHAFNNKNMGAMDDLVALAESCDDLKTGVGIFSRVHGFHALPNVVQALKKIKFKVAIADMPGPVTGICDLLLPLSHPLESWGDAEPVNGIRSIVQPAIEPLHDTKSEGDMLFYLMEKPAAFRDYMTKRRATDETWFDRGVETTEPEPRPVESVKTVKLDRPETPYKKNCLYITPSLRTYDGRGAGIDLAQEIPDPLSAVSYGRYMAISPIDAREKKLTSGDIANLETVVGKLEIPVVELPGLAPGIMTISIDALWGLDKLRFCLEDVTLTKTGKSERLAILSGARQTGDRGILPHLEKRHGSHHEYQRHTLYPPHEHKTYRWGMVIDLDLCIGCSACAAACYIENNVPVVGGAEHIKGREMSWLRIEAYYNDPGRPEFVPMLCQQCDNAPCENVCPVFATYHNPEGLNAQVYNRCVGTRYCANNCPYKVRRFNWFSNENSLPLYRTANPELSVRPKGIMEKCTFCIQRIRYAKDRARDENRLVADGEITPACAQTCPTGAITFGSLLDPGSRVSRLSKSKQAYRIQEQLGTEPAIYYIKATKKKNGTAMQAKVFGGPGPFFQKGPWPPEA
jgi:molybdopterin-containing oxidoreductase family iron-sulfur binding subunit